MSLRRTLPVAIASAALLSPAAVDASRFRPLPPEDGSTDTPHTTREADLPAAKDRPLPYARGRRFATLDEYLAFRRGLGAIDLPWYEEIAPGTYALRTSMRPQPRERRFTRAQLAQQFGFDR